MEYKKEKLLDLNSPIRGCLLWRKVWRLFLPPPLACNFSQSNLKSWPFEIFNYRNTLAFEWVKHFLYSFLFLFFLRRGSDFIVYSPFFHRNFVCDLDITIVYQYRHHIFFFHIYIYIICLRYWNVIQLKFFFGANVIQLN